MKKVKKRRSQRNHLLRSRPCYKNSEMCEVSDPELWMRYNHGGNSPSSSPSEDDPLDNEVALHRAMVENQWSAHC